LAQSVKFFIGILNAFGAAAFVGLALAALSAVATATFAGRGVGLRADGNTEPKISATVGRVIAIELFLDFRDDDVVFVFLATAVSSSSGSGEDLTVLWKDQHT